VRREPDLTVAVDLCFLCVPCSEIAPPPLPSTLRARHCLVPYPSRSPSSVSPHHVAAAHPSAPAHARKTREHTQGRAFSAALTLFAAVFACSLRILPCVSSLCPPAWPSHRLSSRVGTPSHRFAAVTRRFKRLVHTHARVHARPHRRWPPQPRRRELPVCHRRCALLPPATTEPHVCTHTNACPRSHARGSGRQRQHEPSGTGPNLAVWSAGTQTRHRLTLCRRDLVAVVPEPEPRSACSLP
jgi:hypothetical protein